MLKKKKRELGQGCQTVCRVQSTLLKNIFTLTFGQNDKQHEPKPISLRLRICPTKHLLGLGHRSI